MNDDMTASESAILMMLMAEAREVLNTELTELYGLDVRKPQRDKLQKLGYIASERRGRTYALQLADKGWLRMQDDFDFRLRGAGALGSALTALHGNLRRRVLVRAACANLAELFALSDLRSAAPRSRASDSDLRVRIVSAYDALADEPRAWVSLRRLRPFFADVPRDELDDALRRLALEDDVNVAPEPSQGLLTDADIQAALRLGAQDNHLLAIGV
ncbi:hypothetical protein [Cryptosporangium sp. NPDC051539]|uniref:hypothetical protein n=1 Tax=Cryptosporangium sp. NPDC051539 TaxID=3363962 RepID=UPI0037AA365C